MAAAFMAGAIWLLHLVLPFQGGARLALDVVVGTTSYAAALLGLWELSGRPRSAEQDILTLVAKAQAAIARVGILPETAD